MGRAHRRERLRQVDADRPDRGAGQAEQRGGAVPRAAGPPRQGLRPRGAGGAAAPGGRRHAVRDHGAQGAGIRVPVPRPAQEPGARRADAIEFFGFGGREEDSPWELSQGGRQRLALAALLVGAPGVLVLDEPTTGQDADHMRAFLGLLDRIRARTSITIVTVTHDIRGLASRASRVVLLGEGRVRMDGPANRVFAATGELDRWGVLAPPLARLQSALLGPAAADVLLDAGELAAAVLAHRPDPAAAGRGAGALRP